MARSRNLTMRVDPQLLDRLERRAQRVREPKSRLAQRYIEEGMAVEEHPGIVFRDGPAGRRPGVAAGPDVWQLIGVLKGSGKRGERAIEHTAEWLNLDPVQVRTAVGYYAAHQAEIDDWIRRNDEEAEAAEAAWLREQEALA